MTKAQTHPSLADNRFTIRVRQGNSGLTVLAPLPDEFGFTVGSEFSAPFDGQMLQGGAGKILAVGGVANKRGVQTKKLYTSPEPTEISFDMHFEAYENAGNDVMAPTTKIMYMSLGSSLTMEESKQTINDVLGLIPGLDGAKTVAQQTTDDTIEAVQNNQNASKAWEFLNFLQGPSTVTIHFGKVITFKKAYISSVSPSFSNVMNKDGIPMSCTVSVTAILEKDPVTDDENFEEFFSGITGG